MTVRPIGLTVFFSFFIMPMASRCSGAARWPLFGDMPLSARLKLIVMEIPEVDPKRGNGLSIAPLPHFIMWLVWLVR